MHLDSPKGLMLHGEVGTGKSMLIDLFADCLPNRKKRRWHFNTFMLETLSKLEVLRRSRTATFSPSRSAFDDEHSLLVVARDMIETSPILFLDEFQLPDRAASKIMSNLMTSFFHLGGVLIATSNRMPEELAKAAGMEFTPPPSRMDSLRWRFGVQGKSENMFIGRGDFAPFLEVLKARCEVWEMGGGKDYRRSESEAESQDAAAKPKLEGTQTFVAVDSTKATATSSDSHVEDSVPKMASMPKHYFVKPSAEDPTSAHEEWQQNFKTAESLATANPTTPWTPSTILVYGRRVPIPRTHAGVTSWTFRELCESSRLGPADYITLASTYHTLLLTDVPVLSLLQKNEARRFITLLDALYEARCKLLITAAAGPDDIFFPETPRNTTTTTATKTGDNDAEAEEDNDDDALYSETISDIYQDATAPFRPNISSYHAHTLAPDALEDDPPNRTRRGTATGSFAPDRDYAGGSRPPDFTAQTASAFTGEDERFAYKRARSRLWEMCGARWWARTDDEEGGDAWWRPLPREVRRWEGGASGGGAVEEGGRREEVEVEVGEGMQGSPFRTDEGPPPKIGWAHVWGTVRWGKRAGAWGKGVEGLGERRRERGGEGEGR